MKSCHSCSYKKAQLGADSPAFTAWYVEHQDDCSINYHGSSNAMEMKAVKRLWGRSVQTNGLSHTGVLGGGDSKAYQAVVEQEPYGPDVKIVRKESVTVNHAHKRMGTALLKLSREKKLGGRGRGRLTKDKAIRLQHYYRYAITASGGDADNMRDRVWATLFHCMSTRRPTTLAALLAQTPGASSSGHWRPTRSHHPMKCTSSTLSHMMSLKLWCQSTATCLTPTCSSDSLRERHKTSTSHCIPSSGAVARRRCLYHAGRYKALLLELSERLVHTSEQYRQGAMTNEDR